jgi:soluble lytic murein transglycosylase-like protein
LNMCGKVALFSVVTLLSGAVLGAQPPADFEASVKAAMAPSITQQRAAVQKQASSIPGRAPAGSASTASVSAASSFFTIPFAPSSVSAADCDPLPAAQLDPLIEAAAQRTGVDAELVRAVIDKESAGRSCALSAKGAQGLMQLMPATADELDVDDPFDPKQNVEAGAKLLKSLLARYNNDPALALGAYNAGPERVDQQGGVPPIPETVDYVTAILEKLRSLTSSKPSSAIPEPAKNFGW